MHPSFNDVISAMKIATCTVSLSFYAAAFFHLAFYSFVTRVTQSSSERCFLKGNKQGRPLRVDPFLWHLQHFGLRRLNVRMLRKEVFLLFEFLSFAIILELNLIPFARPSGVHMIDSYFFNIFLLLPKK